MTVYAASLVSPPTDRVEDWQVVVDPTRSSPPRKGEDGEGAYDGSVNHHVTAQLLGWGANTDSSFIVDHGAAYRYMVKLSSKGESRSREAQTMLSDIINEAHDLGEHSAGRNVAQMRRSVMMWSTTRRDMGVQEVMHLLMQAPRVEHNVQFKRSTT